jgi:hypothetical protein
MREQAAKIRAAIALLDEAHPEAAAEYKRLHPEAAQPK